MESIFSDETSGHWRDMHGIHEFEKGSIDDAGYGNPMFLAIYGFHFLCNDVNKKGAT